MFNKVLEKRYHPKRLLVDNQALEQEKTGFINQRLKVIDNQKSTRLSKHINFPNRHLSHNERQAYMVKDRLARKLPEMAKERIDKIFSQNMGSLHRDMLFKNGKLSTNVIRLKEDCQKAETERKLA